MPFYLYEKEGADCIIFLLVLDENTFYNYNVRDEFYIFSLFMCEL